VLAIAPEGLNIDSGGYNPLETMTEPEGVQRRGSKVCTIAPEGLNIGSRGCNPPKTIAPEGLNIGNRGYNLPETMK